jgi:hypothetical protein
LNAFAMHHEQEEWSKMMGKNDEKFKVKQLSFYLPHMEYEESIGFATGKMK